LVVGHNNLDPAIGSIDVIAASVSESAGSCNITNQSEVTSFASLEIGNVPEPDVSFGAIEVVTGDSFTILADIISSSFAHLGDAGPVEIGARLKVNGVEQPIILFNYQEPTGKLGSLLTIRMADADPALVPAGASIDFDLFVIDEDGTHYYNLMTNGKVQERDYSVAWRGGRRGGPADELTFTALDIVADRFSLTARTPVTMYDPTRIKQDTVQTKLEDCIHKWPSGQVIQPVLEPVVGLTMKQILNRAYTGAGGLGFVSVIDPGYYSSSVTLQPLFTSGSRDQIGIGFDRVIINIQDYRVRRADFTLESGWHEGASPCVAMYAPIYFVIDNDLYIIDPDQNLPVGMSPAGQVTLSEHKKLSLRQDFKPDANIVLLTYQYSANDPAEDTQKVSREVFTDTVDEVGIESEPGYSRITTRKWVIEWYLPTEPDNVLATYDKSVEITTEQSIFWAIRDPDDGTTVDTLTNGRRVTHFERLEYQYEGELLVGHSREVQCAISISTELRIQLLTCEHEDTSISWTDDPVRPGVKIQESVRTDIKARCYIDNEAETIYEESGDIEIARKFNVLDAQAAGVVESDMVLTDLIPYKSIRSQLHRVSGTQVNMQTVEVDYVNNTVRRSWSEPTTGNTSTDPYATKSRTVEIDDNDSIADIGPRIPVGVNAYELPRDRAIKLGQRVLARFKDPLHSMPIDLPTPIFSIGRGTIRKGQLRDGTYTGNYIVTGRSISGQGLGQRGQHRIAMGIETTELLETS